LQPLAFDARQARGEREAYQRYLQGMDASMRQKVALTAAHLLCKGRVADMGMGSGAGSHALAALYPSLDVVGVDMDPSMVRMATEKYALPNLSFLVGDIAEDIFPEGSLDGILDSSVLHHVTSFGGYDHERAARCVRAQARALRVHGTLVVRDFVAPAGAGDVLLDLPADDGDDSDDPRRCSTAALLERFAREFRSLHPRPGFSLSAETRASRAGWRRYRLAHRHAVEFVLRKDYRTDWESEVKEEYTYFTQARFEELFASVGMRVLASTPLHNPWIVQHRFAGKLALFDVEGGLLPFPPTNHLIVGEKVVPGEAVGFRQARAAEASGFVRMTHFRDTRDGAVRDLVRRPNVTIDVVPFFQAAGDVYVLSRMSYPRPILASSEGGAPLDGASRPHYVTEPLNVMQTDRSLGETVEAMLLEHARIAASHIRGFMTGATYYPSPGGTQEEVRSVLVEIDPLFVEENVPNVSGFSTSGRVRAIEAEQVLRAAQVGGLPDARLELNVYDLMRKLGRRPGPWLADEIELAPASGVGPKLDPAAVHRRPSRRVFAAADAGYSRGFLRLECHRFEEIDGTGRVVASGPLELVMPSRRSTSTMVCAPLARIDGVVCLGVDDDDLPAAQCFVGNSHILVAPAWRVPTEVVTLPDARAWAQAKLAPEYGLHLGRTYDLGGRYFPSAGMSPEVVHPIAVEVIGVLAGPAKRALCWLPLQRLVADHEPIVEGHLRVVALRAAHALQLLD
jgi:ubiquinone/menaquinone biosynthesis C-methylase UbiE